MKKKVLFAAMALVALASCSSDEMIGVTGPQDNSPSGDSNAIVFASASKGITRADIVGDAAADLLGNNFYVTGTKADVDASPSIPVNSPTTKLVFDNYLVHYDVNTAGKTESNTANWEYVGITPGTTAGCVNNVQLGGYQTGEGHSGQTIKFWDFSVNQYDFFAFSTGDMKAVEKTNLTGSGDDKINADEIGVTAMKYGADLANGATAYTFYIPNITALKNAYITDITEVEKANYGKEVKLQFKNLASKIRLALYETVPGYSVEAGSVKFYSVSKADDAVDDLGTSTTTAYLISDDASYGFATCGEINVSFPNVGTNNKTNNSNYNKASAVVTPVGTPLTTQSFDALATDKYAFDEADETEGKLYLGRTLPQATFAGVSALDYYQLVFPVSSDSPTLTLRVDYTLVSTDGSGEKINVYGAKAVVPSTYTKWQPNYAYTYIFKISDNTNGWTSTDASDTPGLFPITFDAVVAEIKDVSGEQTTVTTVATPTITTYQQNHKYGTNEYSKSTVGKDGAVRDLYVQVMDNAVSPATLKTDLNGTTPTDATNRSLLYAVTNAVGSTPISEATVMDALQNQSSVSSGNITGRNGILLTKNDNITTTGTNSKFDIVNGPDDKKIQVNEGEAAKISMTAVAKGTYAYVYDYTTAALGKTNTTIYQLTSQKSGVILSSKKYITTTILKDVNTYTAEDEDVSASYVYFSKTTTDGTNYTYSFYSVDGKTKLPEGLLKVGVGLLNSGNGVTEATANTFVFETYTRNNGLYAVKIIKIVD